MYIRTFDKHSFIISTCDEINEIWELKVIHKQIKTMFEAFNIPCKNLTNYKQYKNFWVNDAYTNPLSIYNYAYACRFSGRDT